MSVTYRFLTRPRLCSGNDAANAATVLPASGEVLVAGWREVSGVGCRSVTKLSATGTEAYTAVAFGDSSGAHGAFEMVKVRICACMQIPFC